MFHTNFRMDGKHKLRKCDQMHAQNFIFTDICQFECHNFRIAPTVDAGQNITVFSKVENQFQFRKSIGHFVSCVEWNKVPGLFLCTKTLTTRCTKRIACKLLYTRFFSVPYVCIETFGNVPHFLEILISLLGEAAMTFQKTVQSITKRKENQDQTLQSQTMHSKLTF